MRESIEIRRLKRKISRKKMNNWDTRVKVLEKRKSALLGLVDRGIVVRFFVMFYVSGGMWSLVAITPALVLLPLIEEPVFSILFNSVNMLYEVLFYFFVAIFDGNMCTYFSGDRMCGIPKCLR